MTVSGQTDNIDRDKNHKKSNKVRVKRNIIKKKILLEKPTVNLT